MIAAESTPLNWYQGYGHDPICCRRHRQYVRRRHWVVCGSVGQRRNHGLHLYDWGTNCI